MRQGGVGTPSELMDLNDLSLNQLFLASAHVLQSQGGDAADIALLNSLAVANLSALPAHVVDWAPEGPRLLARQ